MISYLDERYSLSWIHMWKPAKTDLFVYDLDQCQIMMNVCRHHDYGLLLLTLNTASPEPILLNVFASSSHTANEQHALSLDGDLPSAVIHAPPDRGIMTAIVVPPSGGACSLWLISATALGLKPAVWNVTPSTITYDVQPLDPHQPEPMFVQRKSA